MTDRGVLWPGERLLFRGKCNAIITPTDYGLSRFAAGGMLGLVGLAGKEAIGGHLHVTNLRVLFAAHRFNRMRGHLSVPVPAIDSAQRWRSGLAMGVQLTTASTTQRYVTWSGGKVLGAVARARSEFTADDQELLSAATSAAAAWRVNRAAEVINQSAAALFLISKNDPSTLDLLSLDAFCTDD